MCSTVLLSLLLLLVHLVLLFTFSVAALLNLMYLYVCVCACHPCKWLVAIDAISSFWTNSHAYTCFFFSININIFSYICVCFLIQVSFFFHAFRWAVAVAILNPLTKPLEFMQIFFFWRNFFFSLGCSATNQPIIIIHTIIIFSMVTIERLHQDSNIWD